MSKLTLSFKGNLLKYFPLHEGEILIGSDPACGIFIDSLAIQPQHASLTVSGKTALLRDLDTPDGTFVNGTRTSGEVALKNGDNIRIGKHNLLLALEPATATPEVVEEIVAAPAPEPKTVDTTAPATQPEPAVAVSAPKIERFVFTPTHTPRDAFLQILNGHNVGKTISLKRSLVNLGTPGIQLAVIAHRNGGFFLSHLEGDSPTLVDDKPIGDKAWQLQDGNIIEIAKVRMQFTLY